VRTVVSTNFVFWGRNGKIDLCFTLALTYVLSPGERILAITIIVIRLTVRQIPARGFSRGRRTVLLLHEVKTHTTFCGWRQRHATAESSPAFVQKCVTLTHAPR
jgi:hypothetical protein